MGRSRSCRAAMLGGVLLLLLPLGALAQSSNSSSNCSDGKCTRLDTYIPENGRRGQGWARFEAWDTRRGPPPREARRAEDRWPAPRRPSRDNDDDDRDDD